MGAKPIKIEEDTNFSFGATIRINIDPANMVQDTGIVRANTKQNPIDVKRNSLVTNSDIERKPRNTEPATLSTDPDPGKPRRSHLTTNDTNKLRKDGINSNY